jgi:glycosyltransferase involved in cell wall biosynthesis
MEDTEVIPAVSVIIPNYNHAHYLTQRIDTVLNQNYQDIEVIILDDCSTDNSREIIERYRNNKKVSHITYNTENSANTFRQWDKGINLAKGKYIWLAESDDWSEPNFLETIMSGLKKNENIVLGYSQSYCINGDNKIRFQSNHPVLSEYVNGKKFINEYLVEKNPIFNAGMAVWKKEVYHKISKDFLNYKLIGDYCFWIEVCNHGDVFISGKLLNYFRTHEKNVSVNSFKSGLLFIEQIPLLKRLLDEKIIERTNYIKALKRTYSSFMEHKKTIPKENIQAIKKLFLSASVVDLKFSFYAYKIKSRLKRMRWS